MDGVKSTSRIAPASFCAFNFFCGKEGCQLEYYDLFDSACPLLPPNAELPFIIIAGEKFSSGGKLNIPGISKRVAELLEMPPPHSITSQ